MPFGWIGAVRHDEADSREQLSGVPLDLGHHSTRTIPRARPVGEIVVCHHGLARLQHLRSCLIGLNLSPQHGVGWQPDGVEEVVLFQVLVDLRAGKAGVAPELFAQPRLGVPFYNRVQQIPPAIRAGDVTLSQHRAFTVAELVEAEQRVIADASVVTVVLGSLLLAMYRALRTIQVQDETLGLRMGHRRRDPRGIQRHQPFPVALGREYLGLETSHGISRCCLPLTRSSAHNQPHRRVPSKTIRIIGVGVSRQATVDRLSDQRHQVVLDVASLPPFLQKTIRHLGQPELIIQLAVGQQSSVGGDLAAHKLQPHSSVELQAQRLLLAFTHAVPPAIIAAMPAAML